MTEQEKDDSFRKAKNRGNLHFHLVSYFALNHHNHHRICFENGINIQSTSFSLSLQFSTEE